MKQSQLSTLVITSIVGFQTRTGKQYIIHGVFVFSPKHFGAVPHLQHDSKSGAVQRRVGDLPRQSFSPLIVDLKWHLWDTLIKQFSLLLRPGR